MLRTRQLEGASRFRVGGPPPGGRSPGPPLPARACNCRSFVVSAAASRRREGRKARAPGGNFRRTARRKIPPGVHFTLAGPEACAPFAAEKRNGRRPPHAAGRGRYRARPGAPRGAVVAGVPRGGHPRGRVWPRRRGPPAGRVPRRGRGAPPPSPWYPAAPAMASSRCAPRRAFNASCPGNAARAAPLAARRSPPVSPCSPPYPYRAYRSTVYPAPPSPSPGCPRGTGSGSCPPGRGRARPRTPSRPWT